MSIDDSALSYSRKVNENQNRLLSELRTSYDVVICVAGTSGLVLAARLAEVENLKVLLLEAGPQDDDDRIIDPNAWPSLLGSQFDWAFRAEANVNLNGRSIEYPMGKGFGGRSSINVSTWSRGHKSDWDLCAQLTGDEKWNHQNVFSLYRNRIERRVFDAASADQTQNGMVHIQQAPNPHPFSMAFLEAAQSIGLERHIDHNTTLMEATQGGCCLVDEAVFRGRRQSIFRAYTYRAMANSNLTVINNARVTYILFDGIRAKGVRFYWRGHNFDVDATLEVVLSSGAVNTPKLLMQSGIGAPVDLRRLDIAVISALPSVGQNLHDHAAITCVWSAGEDNLPQAPRSQVVAQWRTDAALHSANVCATMIGIPLSTPENAAWIDPPKEGWSFVVGLSTSSRGTIRLTGKEPDNSIAIETNFLGDPNDMTALVAAIEKARDLARIIHPELVSVA